MYNPAKAAQIIAYFALKTGVRAIDLITAMKLVYLADRESLKRYAFPMLMEQRWSLPNGPINSDTYDHAKGKVRSDEWSAVLCDRIEHTLPVREGVVFETLDRLSDADIGILEDVWAKFGGMRGIDLIHWTHDRNNVPEWESPGKSSAPIALERILECVGIGNVKQQAEFIRDRASISSLLASLA